MLATKVNIRGMDLAIVRCSDMQTLPHIGASLLTEAQRIFPALPIMLLAPRVNGHSKSFATFELNKLIREVNADELDWQDHAEPNDANLPLPF
jgi:hypothetical protein